MSKHLRILATSQIIPGHLNPMIAAALELRDRGHEVAFYSGAKAHERIKRFGFRAFAMDRGADQHLHDIIYPAADDGAGTVADKKNLWDLGAPARAMKAWFLETVPQQVADLENIQKEFSPDVMLCDVTLMGPLLILNEKNPGTPSVVLSVIPPCPIPGPGAPPWGLGLPLPNSIFGKLRNEAVRSVSRMLLRSYAREANAVRRRYDLPPIDGPIASVYARASRFLVCGAPTFDFNRKDLPVNVHYVGLCDRAVPEEEVPGWLAALPLEHPVVHVTEGTVHSSRPLLLTAAAEGLAGEPYEVVISTGGRDPATLELGPGAANIRVEEYVPHAPLFARSAALITTGSAGTICKGFVAGLPQIIVPIGWEHAENAARMTAAGAGIRLDPKSCNPSRIKKALATLLGDPAYVQNARKLGADLTAQGGASRAADHVEAAAAAN